MEEIYITEEFNIDDSINRINELVTFYCEVYSLSEEEEILLRQPILRAILLALNEYINQDLHDNFIFYVAPFVKMAVAEFRTHN
jgi:hypothetical protein